MRESQFGFSYSWTDLKPIRPLVSTVVFGQLVGAAAGLYLAKHPRPFINAWAGAALATFPCFLLGLLIQRQLNALAIGENRVMVRRLGSIALILSLAVFVMPLDRM